jgi:hypothetical protein
VVVRRLLQAELSENLAHVRLDRLRAQEERLADRPGVALWRQKGRESGNRSANRPRAKSGGGGNRTRVRSLAELGLETHPGLETVEAPGEGQ